MISYEYIYTSWKVGGGFSTFAKSDDITAEEYREITQKLVYSKPVDLPDRPTPQEIELDFPKNSVYFRLKSGRYCMAQSAYVGKDYAMDVNPRWGNYIIHAFVFDSPDGALAAGYLGSELYKRGLTDEERAYSSITVPPPMELESEDPELFAEEYLEEIFEKGEDGEFFTFLQAVIDRYNTDNCIVVGISEGEKIKRWLKAMTLVLPKPFVDFATYGTYLLYKDDSYRINFIYNYSAFDVKGEIARCPDSAVLFFDSDTVYGVGETCEYLSEYRESYGKNPRAAYRLKYDTDSVFESDPEAELSYALKIKHYLNRNVRYFSDLADFKELTVYILNRKDVYPRASETAMYMIKNSFFSDEDKRSLFFIGDVFLQLEEGEQEAVRHDYFAECFRNAETAGDFVAEYEGNALVTGEYSPLTYGFFLRFIENRGAEAQKAIRFIVELGETKYHEFDESLKAGYFNVAKVYFIGSVKSGNYASAEKCIRRIKLLENGDSAGAAKEIIKEVITEKIQCWGDTDFDFAMLELFSEYRNLYWQLFRTILAGLQSERETYREFVNSYADKVIGSGMEYDSDIAEYAQKYNFESFLNVLKYKLFTRNNSKTAHDFADAYNSLFGIGRPYEKKDDMQRGFYSELSAFLDSVKDQSTEGNEQKKDSGIYMWLSEMNVFIPLIEPDAADSRLLTWLTDEFEKNMTVEEMAEMSDVSGRIIFVRGWHANAREYPVLVRYLDVLSVSNRRSREQFPPYYLKDIDGVFGRLPEKHFLSSVRGLVLSMFKDRSLNREECDVLLSPLMMYKDSRYKGKVYDAVADCFEHAVAVGNIEPFVWAVDYYITKLPRRGDAGVAAEKIEDSLIFPMLEKNRKSFMSMVDDNKKAYAKDCPQVLDYLDGVSFNMLNKPKRTRSMKLKR